MAASIERAARLQQLAAQIAKLEESGEEGSAEATQLAADLDALFATPVAPDAALDPAAVVAESREAADGCDPTVATPILEPVSVPFARQPGGEKGPLAEVSAPPPPPKEKTPLCGACFRPATATV